MIGYKVAKHGDTRVIVTLEIPEDAQTNMGRSSVAVRETATYRANKAKVLAIEDDSGASYASAASFSYNKKSLTYKVGEMIEEPSFNPDPEKVCAEGIHYFLSRRVAELYSLPVENGLYQSWHENGQKWEEAHYVDGKHHGLYQSWHPNGQKEIEMTCPDGKCLYWHQNGQKYMEGTWVNGKRHGLFQRWNKNGTLLEEGIYEHGLNAGGSSYSIFKK